MNTLNRFADPVYCIMRLFAGLMFACWGAQITLGMFGGNPASGKLIIHTGGWIELVGGLLIAFGLFTRLAAFICSGTMAVAYFMFHVPHGFFPILNKGELAVLYCWFFLFVFFYGPGRWSIDAFIRRGRAATPTAVTS